VADEQLDEALAMAQKARQLAPSKASYAMLLAQVYVRQENVEAARQVLEPLTRDTDASVRTEAQDLLDSLNKTSAARSGNSRAALRPSTALIGEPVQPRSSVMIGGAVSGGAIRDGQTIDNSGPMPAVEEVLARYVQALGGAAAINAVSSRVTKGTLDIVGVSRNGSFEIDAQAPNKTLTIMEAHPMGVVKVGCNGRNGWARTAAGLRPLKGVELAALLRDSDLYAPVRFKSNYVKLTLAGKSKIGYREIYVLDLQPSTGAVERVYLDAETYLPIRVDTVRASGSAMAPVEIQLDDWRAVDGIKLPFFISQSSPGLTLVFNVTEIRHNVALDASLFEAPLK
jgi:Tetratricopeptide repeat